MKGRRDGRREKGKGYKGEDENKEEQEEERR